MRIQTQRVKRLADGEIVTINSGQYDRQIYGPVSAEPAPEPAPEPEPEPEPAPAPKEKKPKARSKRKKG